jgi:hypothetical protein
MLSVWARSRHPGRARLSKGGGLKPWTDASGYRRGYCAIINRKVLLRHARTNFPAAWFQGGSAERLRRLLYHVTH